MDTKPVRSQPGGWLDLVHIRAGMYVRRIKESWPVRRIVDWFAAWRTKPYSGPATLVIGTAFITVLLLLLRRISPLLPTPPGVAYFPLIAMLAYYWSWGLVWGSEGGEGRPRAAARNAVRSSPSN